MESLNKKSESCICLIDIINDLIKLILNYITENKDKNSVIRTCKNFHDLGLDLWLKDNEEALFHTCINGYTEYFERWKDKWNLTANNNYPIRYASANGHSKMIKILLRSEERRVGKECRL